MDNDKKYTDDMQHPRRNNFTSNFSPRKILGLVFGIFMFLVYEGMGILMLINYFGWTTNWAWTRWIVGVVLIIYGIYRGYRAFNDITRYDDSEE